MPNCPMNAFNPNTGTITFADERKKAVALGKELIVGDVYSITFKETTIPALKCYVGIPYWGQTARPSVMNNYASVRRSSGIGSKTMRV